MSELLRHPVAQFLRALSAKWWPLMSCAVFTVISIYAAVGNKSNRWSVTASLVTAVIMFVVAAYQAWKREYDAKMEALARHHRERPLLILEATRHDGNIDFWKMVIARRESVFRIQNYGDRAARFITIEPLQSASGKFTLVFDQVDVLPATGASVIRFETLEDGKRSAGSSSTEMFLRFLSDNPANEAKLVFDTAIIYRDTDNTPMRDETRLECEYPLMKLKAAPAQRAAQYAEVGG